MNEKEWEEFWEFLLRRADKTDEWWLAGWLDIQKMRFENERMEM